jgi:hypothetical protein
MHLGAGRAADDLIGVIRNIVVIMIVQPMLDHERCLRACENSVGHASQKQSGDFSGDSYPATAQLFRATASYAVSATFRNRLETRGWAQKRGVSAIFFIACAAALELEQVVMEEI